MAEFEFEFQQMYEVWKGSTFINYLPHIPRRPQRGLEVCGPVYTLRRSCSTPSATGYRGSVGVERPQNIF